MLPLPIIQMVVRNWKLIAAGVVLVCLAAGVWWFRGVLADNAKLTAENGAQSAELAAVTGEIERMNRRDALDQALFEQVEAQRILHAAEIRKQTAEIRKLREKLNAATQECYSHILPDDYLDRLP